MKKILLLIVLSVIGLGSIVSVNTKSAGLADPNDLLIVSNPVPNSKVRGTIPVTFRIYDDEQAYIQYQASIHDPATCDSIAYGNINSSGIVNSHRSQNNAFNWNTETTLLTTNLRDGNYCFRVCAALLNETQPYSVCNSRMITIINDNERPVITSTPAKLKYLEGESFSYQVTATDPDNDTLSYRFVTTTNFLSINPQTGLITSTPLSTLGNAGLYYDITIAVSDGLSGETTQSFRLEITRPQPTVPNPPTQPPTQPTPTDPGPGKNPTDPAPTQPEKKLAFEVPTKDTVFTDKSNLIRWTLPNVEIKTLKLEYSKDMSEWTQIGEPFTGSRTYFAWDVAEMEDDKYYLRLVLEKTDGQIIQAISPQFEIRLNLTEDPNEVETAPIITSEQPENNSEVSDVNSKISASFLPATGETIDTESFTIELDGKDIKEQCEVTEEGFECTLTEALSVGRHFVSVSIKDTSDQTAKREWIFTVLSDDPGQTPNGDDKPSDVVNILGRDITKSGLILIGIILCIGGALLFIPWILYSIWSRGGDDEKVTKTKTTTTYQNTLPEITPYSSDSLITPYDPNSAYDINSSGSDYSFSTDSTTTNTTYPSIDSYEPLPSTQPVQSYETQPSSEPLAPIEPLAPAPGTPDSLAGNTNQPQETQNNVPGYVEPPKS